MFTTVSDKSRLIRINTDVTWSECCFSLSLISPGNVLLESHLCDANTFQNLIDAFTYVNIWSLKNIFLPKRNYQQYLRSQISVIFFHIIPNTLILKHCVYKFYDPIHKTLIKIRHYSVWLMWNLLYERKFKTFLGKICYMKATWIYLMFLAAK